MQPRNLLVTGATGFIGQQVMRELADRDIPSYALLRTLPANPLPGDVLPILHDLRGATIPATITHCLHLAWGHLPDYRNDIHLTGELPAQRTLLTTLLAHGLRKLVVSGTCLEYGMQQGELDETAPLQPTLPYSRAKVELLDWLLTQQHACAFDLCWARLFYIYGMQQNPKALLPQLRAAVTRGDASFPMSLGQQQRDFLPVESAAAHLVDLLMLDGDHGPVNLCSGAPMTVEERTRQWLAQYDWRIALDLGYYPYPDYEPMAFWGNRHKLDRLLLGART